MSNDELFERLAKGDLPEAKWRSKFCKKIVGGNPNSRQSRTDPKDTEAEIKREVKLKAQILGIKLWNQQAGKVWAGPHPVHLAPQGAADLTGILPDGRRLEVECKRRHGGIQSDKQKEWEQFIKENRGIYLLVHSGEEFGIKIRRYI